MAIVLSGSRVRQSVSPAVAPRRGRRGGGGGRRPAVLARAAPGARALDHVARDGRRVDLFEDRVGRRARADARGGERVEARPVWSDSARSAADALDRTPAPPSAVRRGQSAGSGPAVTSTAHKAPESETAPSRHHTDQPDPEPPSTRARHAAAPALDQHGTRHHSTSHHTAAPPTTSSNSSCPHLQLYSCSLYAVLGGVPGVAQSNPLPLQVSECAQ